jgi:DNA phosphorothioation-dependent restriction protein DptG
MVSQTLAVRSSATSCLAPEIRSKVSWDDVFGTLREVDEKYLECCEMWHRRRMERASWTDSVRKEEVLQKVLQTMKTRKLIGLVTS